MEKTMPKTQKKTRTFRERQCAHCSRADKREMRMNRPNYCSYVSAGKDPDIRNGHCTPFLPIKRGRQKKSEESNSTEG